MFGSASSRARRVGQSAGSVAEDVLAWRQWRLGLRGLLLSVGFALSTVAATASVPCETITHLGSEYIVCTVDLRSHDLRLFLNDDAGRPMGSFSAVRAALDEDSETLAFGVNGGMYHRDRSPVGLYIEDGRELSALSTRDGPGNFHLLPNGVFGWEHGRAFVMESRSYQSAGITPDYATQSGPMLVIDGKLHPRFLPNGTSNKIRNGVGVQNDGHTVVFAISKDRVNFHDFGTLFRDRLDTPNALFLDGTISSLYSPTAKRADGFWPMGPIIGVVERDR